jgi:hypothetical protein
LVKCFPFFDLEKRHLVKARKDGLVVCSSVRVLASDSSEARRVEEVFKLPSMRHAPCTVCRLSVLGRGEDDAHVRLVDISKKL